MDPSRSEPQAAQDAVDELLSHCLDAPPEQWPKLLASLRAEHPIHATELGRRFERLVRLGIVAPPPSPPASPERLGPYRLLRRLGSGTTGIVWLAADERLNREVALKILRPEHLYFEGARQRFRREMTAAVRLGHPALCPIYEAGEQDGVPFLAMRYVSGPSLAEWIDLQRASHAGSPPTASQEAARCDKVCAWVSTVALALHEAHEAGFVHRDVKPGNVLLDKDAQPVLLDFGLAHALDPEQGAQLTATGAQLVSSGDKVIHFRR